MKHTFAMNAFMKWLPANSHRFHSRPYNIRRHNNSVTFNLTRITQLLKWSVSEQEATLLVCHKIPDEKSDFWDALISFEVRARRNSACQYYCDMCEHYRNKTDKRQYYPSKLALWESHCFENILTWCNKEIIAGKQLSLEYSEASSTRAILFMPVQWQDYKQDHDDPFKVVPVKIT